MQDIHLLTDLIALLAAFYVRKVFFVDKNTFIFTDKTKYKYYTTLIVGVFIGSFFFGSLNTFLSKEELVFGKSILGGLFTAIIFSEIFKKINNINYSTGAYFIIPFCLSIVIGRIGCFLSGLDDFTYGIPTDFILGYSFSGGIYRHPVQLYESFSMLIFLLIAIYLYRTKINIFEKNIFYYFVLFYATQRFIWEFLKPYKTIFLSMNIFHIISFLLILYALYFIYRSQFGKLQYKIRSFFK